MTQFIAHRINTVEALRQVPREYGIEVDLRDYGDRLILQHDPFLDGENFDDFLEHYHHAFIILNIKSERIEHEVMKRIERFNIAHYFFLDSSFPMIVQMSPNNPNFAVRFSEFEKLDTVLAMKDRVRWVWVDCFRSLPIDTDNYKRLKTAGLKLCLVSPELQGRPNEIAVYRDLLLSQGIQFDAICTKLHQVPVWQGQA